jgi:hypoxanthine phosphoribosyltransferase
MALARLKIIIPADRIQRLVRKLAGQIDCYALSKSIPELTVVCVMDGAFMFCADLVRQMATPTALIFVKARSYSGARKGITRLAPISGLTRGRPALVVDTILDTGKTIERVIHEVRKHTSRVSLAVLVEKRGKGGPQKMWRGIETFSGVTLATDRFLVGYGLDWDGKYRQLRDIRACNFCDECLR